jgi:hypothetical protein
MSADGVPITSAKVSIRSGCVARMTGSSETTAHLVAGVDPFQLCRCEHTYTIVKLTDTVVLIDRHHRHEPSAGIGQSDVAEECVCAARRELAKGTGDGETDRARHRHGAQAQAADGGCQLILALSRHDPFPCRFARFLDGYGPCHRVSPRVSGDFWRTITLPTPKAKRTIFGAIPAQPRIPARASTPFWLTRGSGAEPPTRASKPPRTRHTPERAP